MKKRMVLYVVATPIGNLQDLSYRAKEVLTQVESILCEDTRETRKLLDYYGIKGKKLIAFHDHNEQQKTPLIIKELKKGTAIALVCDKGTPTVSDPGFYLIRACRKEHIPIVPIPGPTAAITALMASGFATDQFYFLGFLPKKKQKKKNLLEKALAIKSTLIIYESPYRLEKTLTLLQELAPQRECCIAKELTKVHETLLFGTPDQLLKNLQSIPLKGAFVLLVNKQTEKPQKQKNI